MDHEEIRMKCLEMARAEGLTGHAVVDRANDLYLYARYGKDEADRLIAEKKRRETMPKARVVGRDTKFEADYEQQLADPDYKPAKE